MAVDGKLLSILVCPVCHGELEYKKQEDELICYVEGLAFPVRDVIPVMLQEEARVLSAEGKVDR